MKQRLLKTTIALTIFILTFSCIESENEFVKLPNPGPGSESPILRGDGKRILREEGISGYHRVLPGSTHQYHVEFYGGNDVVLDGSETIVWMLRGDASYEQPILDHYFDCVNNGDCDGDLDCGTCEDPEVVDFWFENTTATTINITFPNVETPRLYTLVAGIVCGDECFGPSQNKTIYIVDDGH